MANSLFILSTFHRISLSSYHRNSQITKPQFVHKYFWLRLNIKVFTNQTVAFFDKRPVFISQNLVAKLHDFHIELNGLKSPHHETFSSFLITSLPWIGWTNKKVRKYPERQPLVELPTTGRGQCEASQVSQVDPAASDSALSNVY